MIMFIKSGKIEEREVQIFANAVCRIYNGLAFFISDFTKEKLWLQ